VDERGQPDSEPAGAGEESPEPPAAGWQPSANGAFRDVNGNRGDGLRRPPGLRTADTPWSSAGAALEPSIEPSGWRRSLTSGLRGRAEVRSRYADLLAPVSPALPPDGPQVPASAPPYPYEGDLDADRPAPRPAARAWTPQPPERPTPPERPGPAIPAERTAPPAELEPYPPYRPSDALTDNTYDDLPALAQAAAASQAAQAAAQAASAVQAARAAEAAAEAQAVVEDHAAVEAAYRAAVQGGGDAARPTPPNPPAEPRPAVAAYRPPPDPRVPGGAPAEFRAPHRPPLSAVNGPRPLVAAPEPAIEPARPAAVGATIEQARGPVTPLPQRIPAPPDVPEVPGSDEDEPDGQFIESEEPVRSGLAPPELARIATHLRYDEDLEEQPAERPDGFDVNTVLAAVRLVPGVRDAQLRPNPSGVHTLRLDLADGADPGQVSRLVARLLKQKMGLAAEPRRQQSQPRTPPTLRDPGLPKDAVIPGAPPAPRTPPADKHRLADPAQVLAHDEPGPPADERSRHRVSPVRTHGEAEGRRAARPAGTPRVTIDQVQVSTLGLDATVEVRLTNSGAPAYGVASGPAHDGYVLRLAAVAATNAIDQLLTSVEGGEQHGRSFVEHAAVVPFGSCEVAVVVVLLVFAGSVEQLAGSAIVSGDPRQAVVRATLAAVNRRLDALLG
jgi:hypothetical protein